MSIFISFLFILLALPTYGQSAGRVVEGTQFPGGLVVRNFVLNPGCEKNVNNITASGGSLTRSTSSVIEGAGSCLIDSDTSGQTYTWALTAFSNEQDTNGCYLRFAYTGDATDYSVEVRQNSSTIASATLLDASSVTKVMQLGFACGDLAHATTVRLVSSDNAAAAVRVDSMFVGSQPPTKAPTITKLLSGSAQTYNYPAGTKWLKVYASGGGGGGASGGTGCGTGGTGGTTSFAITSGATLISLVGGTGGVCGGAGGTGGAATITAPAVGFGVVGGVGGGGTNAGGYVYTTGGIGGASLFGGGGGGTINGAGTAGAANTGGGGGGGGCAPAEGSGGAGGAAGASAIVVIPPPLAASYTYTIGAAGAAATGGTQAAAAGGAGVIYIEEHY